MKTRKNSRFAHSFCFAVALASGTAVVATPMPAEALDLKKVTRQMKKDFGKAGKEFNKTVNKLNKNGAAGKIITGIGVGVLVGVASDSAAAGIITGLAFAAAPEIFQQNFITTYRGEMEWANSISSNKKRIVVAPGRSVTDEQRAALSSKVTEDVKDVQRALQALGLYKSKIDGDFGPGSRAGVKEFQLSLGEPATGALTAEQRHRLFLQAENSGFARVRVLDEIDKASAVLVSAPAGAGTARPGAAIAAIPEYRLANLRFEKLTADYLKAGSISGVATTQMLPDGTISIQLLTLDGQPGKAVSGKVSGLKAAPHDLSDDWAQLGFTDADGQSQVLNTRDDFTSPTAARDWIEAFNKEIALLSKLTGATSIEPAQPGTIVVQAPDGEAPNAVAASDLPTASGGTVAANDDGTIVVAQVKPEPDAVAPRKEEIVEASLRPESRPAPADGLIGFDAAPETCRQGVYLSFSFPGEDDPVSHYNIISPDGTLNMDNGDKTAYITGSCVQGEYAYSYVHVKKGATEKDWRDVKREGTFQLASNSEQCSINLNTPTGSAEVKCF